MANSKISALTSATTPLAGTETLPVVQSSTTKQVSVTNLTAGRTVTAKSVDLTVTASSSADQVALKVTNNGENGATIDINNAFGFLGQIAITKKGGGSSADEGKYILRLATNSALSDVVTVSETGDQTLNIGNLVIGTSGKGIDFSATPGTGTSELLADYEEGTWTVVWTNLTGTPASTTGYYTKIGRMVYFTYSPGSGTITATAASTRFSLPFTPAIEASGTQISQNVNFSFTTLILPSNSNCYVGTFTSNYMVFSGAYNV
jgi:hypothetical protein